MSLRNYQFKTISVAYDFAEVGGAISTINLGVGVDINTTFVFGQIITTTNLASAGAATVQLVGLNSGAILSPAFAFGTLITGTPLPIITSATLPVADNVAIVIGGAALTAGKFIILWNVTKIETNE